MKSVLFYLKKFNHKTFEEFPFNEIDSLILCQLSYLNLDPFVPHFCLTNQSIPLNELLKKENISRLTDKMLNLKNNTKLLHLLRKSIRFKEMSLSQFCLLHDHPSTKQFSSVTFIFPKFLYIAYRGTDTSLLGWKEDFNLALLDVIPSQKEADNYLKEVCKSSSLPLYIGGHSKGGNLAYYASINAGEFQNRILRIFNYDGPGFSKNIFQNPEYLKIKQRTFKIVPADDVVGVLLHHSDADMIVESKGHGFIQHDTFNWKITAKGKFKTVKNLSFRTRILDKSFNKFFSHLQKDEFEQFGKILFKILGDQQNITTYDMLHKPLTHFKDIKHRIKCLPQEELIIFKTVLRKIRMVIKEETINELSKLKK